MLEMLESAWLGSFTFPSPTSFGQVRIQEFCTPGVGNNSLSGVTVTVPKSERVLGRVPQGFLLRLMS